MLVVTPEVGFAAAESLDGEIDSVTNPDAVVILDIFGREGYV